MSVVVVDPRPGLDLTPVSGEKTELGHNLRGQGIVETMCAASYISWTLGVCSWVVCCPFGDVASCNICRI